ncbi:MAG TPA: hemerythrin family protein [Bryobacteraceae bacterium]|nr:hemerythrin family protein [Bryobacteraceae bacterium]
MHRFKWTKAHEVFLPEVDADHRNLFRLADELETATTKGETARILTTLRTLLAATEDHFTHEEREMRAAHYPAFAWHKQQHDTLRKRFNEFAPRIESGDGDAAILLLDAIADWLQDHTAVTDRMLCSYLRNHQREVERAGRERSAGRHRQPRVAM